MRSTPESPTETPDPPWGGDGRRMGRWFLRRQEGRVFWATLRSLVVLRW